MRWGKKKDDGGSKTQKARARTMKVIMADPVHAAQVKHLQEITAPVRQDLAAIGYHLDWLDDLRLCGEPWIDAIPVLSRWLSIITDPDAKAAIAHNLSFSWVGNRVTAQLIDEFKKADPEKASALTWAIANALAAVDVTGFEKEFIRLARNKKYGTARRVLILRLSKFHDPEAEEAALDLLEDEEVRLCAITTLSNMKSKRALFLLEKLLTHEKSSIRKEARKAITNIMR